MKKRLLLYVIFDKDGIVDDYIQYFLRAVSKFVSHTVIVCNGKVLKDGIDKLGQYTDDVYIRENRSFDAGAIKDVLLNLYGWEKTLMFDELLIANDTFFGPLYPLDEMFDRMEQVDCGFWGITEHKQYRKDFFDKAMDAHLQSYFMNINSDMLHSETFRTFWEELIPCDITVKSDAVADYELAFSRYFVSKGFHYASYIDAGGFESANPSLNYNYSCIDALSLVGQYRCPTVKRSAFYYCNEDRNLSFQANERHNELLSAIERTGYDVGLIWKNILRVANITALKDTLYLEYILPKKQNSIKISDKKTVVVVHLHYEKLMEESLLYLAGIPEIADVVITTSNHRIAECVRQKGYRVRMAGNQGKDLAALLVACRDLFYDYEYLCFTHDIMSELFPRSSKSLQYLYMENTIGSTGYIKNILHKFDSKPFLGLLAVPEPAFSEYFSNLHDRWEGNFDATCKLLEKLKVHVPLSRHKSPFCIGNAFWCRTKALRQLYEQEWTYSDFPEEPMPPENTLCRAIERSFPYVAQSNGYYSGIVMTDSFAEIRLADMTHTVSALLMNTRLANHAANYDEFINSKFERETDLSEFVGLQKTIYVYGTGEFGRQYAYVLDKLNVKVEAYVISDGHPKKESFCGRPVKYFSEIELKDGSGIIIALAYDNLKAVKPIVERRIASEYADVGMYFKIIHN